MLGRVSIERAPTGRARVHVEMEGGDSIVLMDELDEQEAHQLCQRVRAHLARSRSAS